MAGWINASDHSRHLLLTHAEVFCFTHPLTRKHPMPKIQYTRKRFGSVAQSMIDHANVIIDEYAAQGYDLTLRQE